MNISADDIIHYWYSEPMSKHWFSSTEALDAEILMQYQALWQQAANGELDDWRQSAGGCLALAIILDQFPLNMFRHQALSFSTEAKAIEVSLHAVDQQLDKQLPKQQLAFLYMPLMHSENMAHQDLSVKLFSQSGLADNVTFAEHHRDIIKRFGRFPHRNKILARDSSQEELDYLSSDDSFKG